MNLYTCTIGDVMVSFYSCPIVQATTHAHQQQPHATASTRMLIYSNISASSNYTAHKGMLPRKAALKPLPA